MQTRAFRCRSGLVRACWRFAGVAACILLLADLSRTFLGGATSLRVLEACLALPRSLYRFVRHPVVSDESKDPRRQQSRK